MADTVNVDVDFPAVEVEEDGEVVQYPSFKDAIKLTFEEYGVATPESLDAMRLGRYEGWKQHLRDVRSAPVEVPDEASQAATLEEMRDQAAALLAQINAQLAALAAEPAQGS